MLAQDYPWAGAPVAGWVGPQGLDVHVPVDAEAVRGRIAVLAVGSNASPAVLARKLGTQLHHGVPLLPVQVHGMVIAHSAHVSQGGYIPAAPARKEQATTAAVLTWYAPAQTELIDATEPNYRRRRLPGQIHLSAPGQQTPAAWWQQGPVQVYDSTHGVLGVDGDPLTLRPQPQVLAWLNARLPGPDLSPQDLLDPAIGAAVRAQMQHQGLHQPSGLG